MFKLEFYALRTLEDTKDVKEVEESLRRMKDYLKINYMKSLRLKMS